MQRDDLIICSIALVSLRLHWSSYIEWESESVKGAIKADQNKLRRGDHPNLYGSRYIFGSNTTQIRKSKEWFSREVFWKTIPKCSLGPSSYIQTYFRLAWLTTDHSYSNSLFLKCLLFLSCGNGAKKVLKSEILLRWESSKHSFSERSMQLSIIKPDMFSMELARASRTSGKVAASAFSELNQNFFMLAMNREFFLTESTFWTNFYFPSSSGSQPYSQKETQLWVEDWRGALLHRRVSRRASNLFWLWRAYSQSHQPTQVRRGTCLENMLLVLSTPIVWRPQLRCWLRVLWGLWRTKKDGQTRNSHLKWTLTRDVS